MRYVRFALSFVVVALAATPLFASWYPSWSTTDSRVEVGETFHMRVWPTWSGLVDYGGGVHWMFASDNAAIATGSVSLDSTTTPVDFDITGVHPGVAHIRQNGNGFAYVTITVTCGRETPAIAAAPVLRGEQGRVAWLTVVTEYQDRSTFRWYLGKIGDTSHPLDRSSFDAPYVPDSAGAHYIWAEAATLCSTSQVQFRVDVPSRQRAASH